MAVPELKQLRFIRLTDNLNSPSPSLCPPVSHYCCLSRGLLFLIHRTSIDLLSIAPRLNGHACEMFFAQHPATLLYLDQGRHHKGLMLF